jgi:hypothetical protein
MGKKKSVSEVKEALETPAHSLPFEDVIKLLRTDPDKASTRAKQRNATVYTATMLWRKDRAFSP